MLTPAWRSAISNAFFVMQTIKIVSIASFLVRRKWSLTSLVYSSTRESGGKFEKDLSENWERNEILFSHFDEIYFPRLNRILHDLHGELHDECSPLIVNIDENKRPQELVKEKLVNNDVRQWSNQQIAGSTHLLDYSSELTLRDTQSWSCTTEIDSISWEVNYFSVIHEVISNGFAQSRKRDSDTKHSLPTDIRRNIRAASKNW